MKIGQAFSSPHNTVPPGDQTWNELEYIGKMNPWPEWLRSSKVVKTSDPDMAKKLEPSYWALGPSSQMSQKAQIDPKDPAVVEIKEANLLYNYFESCIKMKTCLEDLIDTHCAIREGKGDGFRSQAGKAMRAIPPTAVDTYWKEVGWKEEEKVKKLTLEEAMAREAMLAEATVPEPEPESDEENE